jgi:hypothetical protein
MQLLRPWTTDFFRRRFENLYKEIYDIIVQEALELGIPDFGDIEFDDMKAGEAVLASNLTYSLQDFSNNLHVDDDCQSYFYGMWIPVKKCTRSLASREDGFLIV